MDSQDVVKLVKTGVPIRVPYAYDGVRCYKLYSFLFSRSRLNGRTYTSDVTDPQDTAGLGLGILEIGPSGGILSPL